MMAGMPIKTSAREVTALLRMRFLKLAGGNLSISPLPMGERLQGQAIFILVEVRPIGGGKVPFRIGSLPDQEITDAELAGSANYKIGIRNTSGIQVAADHFIIHVFRENAIFHHPLDRPDDLVPTAITKSNNQYQPIVILCALNCLKALAAQPRLP